MYVHSPLVRPYIQEHGNTVLPFKESNLTMKSHQILKDPCRHAGRPAVTSYNYNLLYVFIAS